jgi:hypothetical protein
MPTEVKMQKIAICILADPKSSDSEEALGRVFNAFILANDLKKNSIPCKIFFQGTGTRWIELLEKDDHPAHGLYASAKDLIEGASMTCATAFKANIEGFGVPGVCNFAVPNTKGAIGLAKYVQEDYTLVNF